VYFHLIIGLLLCAPLLPAAESSILTRWDFEGEHPFHDLTIEGEPPVVISDPLNPANQVMHAVLKPHAERAERSEVRFDRIAEGQERWVGCRILRPDREQFGRVCLFQLGPISGAPGHGGRGLYQILAWKAEDRLFFTFKGYLSRVTDKDFDSPVGELVVGKWDEWVLHLKLSSRDDGHITLWRNGQQLIDRAGQNAFPGDRLAVKWGAYIGAGNVTEQETNVYFDDVVIGDETATYEDVSPGKKSPLP
jgi:Polysaccharide lyase